MAQRLLWPKQTGGVALIQSKVAADAADYMMMSDYMFAEFQRQDPDFAIIAYVYRGHKPYFIEILE